MDSTKTKIEFLKPNWPMQVSQIRHEQRFGVQYLTLDLKTLSDPEDLYFEDHIP